VLKLLPTLLLLVLSSQSFATTPGAIATLCKKQWPGDKGLQSFCITEKRNYQEWLNYTRKRVFNNVEQRNRVDNCIAANKPDYREAYDCVFNSSFFSIRLF
tara:strand:+ start:1582 stop:1884 length:303 start_codon:yes stop_codon:yes gene_type:complete